VREPHFRGEASGAAVRGFSSGMYDFRPAIATEPEPLNYKNANDKFQKSH
jgi:hypothetical protein